MLGNRRQLRLENLEDRRLLAAVNVPTDLQAEVGAEVSVPVNIDQAAGVRGALITLRYDPSLLSLTPEQVTAGTAWSMASDTLVVANVDAAAGTVTVSLSNANEAPAGLGSLVLFEFQVLASATPGTEAAIDLVDVRLNELAIPVDPAPILGPDPTDGKITFLPAEPILADRISGIVFADVDGNLEPGPLEGLPGVTIRLIREATGETLTTQTDDLGRYEFTDLAAGDYQIVQVQPAAYFESGPNELSVTLAEGQALTDQNFREHALRPEFFFLRLLTTPVQPVGSPAWVATLRDIQVASEVMASGSVESAATLASQASSQPETATDAAAVADELLSEGTSGEETPAEETPAEDAASDQPASPPADSQDLPPAEGEAFEPFAFDAGPISVPTPPVASTAAGLKSFVALSTIGETPVSETSVSETPIAETVVTVPPASNTAVAAAASTSFVATSLTPERATRPLASASSSGTVSPAPLALAAPSPDTDEDDPVLATDLALAAYGLW